MKFLIILMISIILQKLFSLLSKIALYFKSTNTFSNEMLKKCNPLTLICERYSIQDKYIPMGRKYILQSSKS